MCLPRAVTHGRRAPSASGTERDGTVRIRTERNGRQITGKKTETERDVPFRSTAVVRNGNVYFLMTPTVVQELICTGSSAVQEIMYKSVVERVVEHEV